MASLTLASRSPRRQAILEQVGISFRVEPADIDESVSLALPPREQAMVAAARKAVAVAERLARRGESGLVLGADTLVAIDGEVMGKPADNKEARSMLRRLSGSTHVVTTGLAIIDLERGTRCLNWEDTRVRMRSVTAQEIAAYVADGEPMDKAGAYAIQGRGAAFVDSIEGCYYNVVGLPVARLLRMLDELNVDRSCFEISENP